MFTAFSQFLNEGLTPKTPAQYKAGDVVIVTRGKFLQKKSVGPDTRTDFWSHDGGLLVKIDDISYTTNSKRWVYIGTVVYGRGDFYKRNDLKHLGKTDEIECEEESMTAAPTLEKLLEKRKYAGSYQYEGKNDHPSTVSTIIGKTCFEEISSSSKIEWKERKISVSRSSTVSHVHLLLSLKQGEVVYVLSDNLFKFPESSLEKGEIHKELIDDIGKSLSEISGFKLKSVDKEDEKIQLSAYSLMNEKLFKSTNFYFCTKEDEVKFLENLKHFLDTEKTLEAYRSLKFSTEVSSPSSYEITIDLKGTALMDAATRSGVDLASIKKNHRGSMLASDLNLGES